MAIISSFTYPGIKEAVCRFFFGLQCNNYILEGGADYFNGEGEWLCTVRLEGGAGCTHILSRLRAARLECGQERVWTSYLFLVVF